jgi:topoisomerase IA-like protein
MMVLSLAPLGHRRCGRANGDVPPLQVQSEKARRLFARKSWRAKGIKRNEEKVKASETKARMAAAAAAAATAVAERNSSPRRRPGHFLPTSFPADAPG